MPKPPLLGEVARRSRDGEVVHSSTCVIPLTLKASFIQPLRRLRRQLPWQGSPWQRGFVSDETDLRLLENVTECQSLSLWERCLRSRRRGQGCCQRARHTAIRTLLVRAIVSLRRWSNFTGLALSDACGASSPEKGSPWQRGFVSDETDLRLLENVTECQSLSLWERCLRSRRRGQGCCQRARHTAIRTLLVRAIVSLRRWSNFTGLALSGADAPAPPKWEPLAKRFRFR